MKIAALQYQYDFPKTFDAYKEKITQLVCHHAHLGVDLLIFPEYAGLEMLSFSPLETLQKDLSLYLDLFQSLSHQHNMLICSGSQVVVTPEGTFNRSYLFSPNKKIGYQDKCITTPYEVTEGIVSQGQNLKLFETAFGKIAICICYDVEFPSLVKKLVNAGARLILVPSYTASIQGFYRVFVSCRARALENQCYVVQSAIVGQTDIEVAYGASAICTPIDLDFPEDGLLAVGGRDRADSVIGELDFTKLEKVRLKGQTHNYVDGQHLENRSLKVELMDLC